MPIPETIYACPVCKSHRVQSQFWVRVNTKELMDSTDRYSWCDACAEDGLSAEINPGDLLEIPPAECRERSVFKPGITILTHGGVIEDVLGLPPGCPITINDYDIEAWPEDELEEDGAGLRFHRIELVG